jgi:leader peptidase (prepilin peptidase)/N-methyltransferase
MEVLLILLAGWLIAFGANYLSDVLPVYRKFTTPVCTHCGISISWKRYAGLQACPSCRQGRSWRTWAVQILYPLVVLSMWYFPPGRLGFWVGSGLLAFFMLVAVIDLEHHLILHPVSLAGAIIGLAVGIWQKGLVDTLLGGVAGFGAMLALYYLGIGFGILMARIRKQEAAEEALGFGDVNLAGFLGLMLGWPEIVGGLIVGILLGGLVSGVMVLGMALTRRYRPLVAIPYAPFLLLGAILFLYIPKQ